MRSKHAPFWLICLSIAAALSTGTFASAAIFSTDVGLLGICTPSSHSSSDMSSRNISTNGTPSFIGPRNSPPWKLIYVANFAHALFAIAISSLFLRGAPHNTAAAQSPFLSIVTPLTF